MMLDDEAKSTLLAQIDTARYRVKAGAPADLDKRDPRDVGDFGGDKAAGKELLDDLADELAEWQEVFYAQGKHRLLIVLQATDTGGKDGTISSVFGEVNPQGVNVASFKRPTALELAHDYLWRIHAHAPANGEMVIFNRSHYEDVLVVRVQLVPRERWQRRYEHINAFEKMLVDEGTTVLKFFLQISKEEQRARLQARIDNPHKHWKFSMGDLDERKRWDDYQLAYAEAIHYTSTDYAPWYVVPADRKWFRNLVVAKTILESIKALNPTYPPATESLDGVVVE
jgi:PPK2 family polyphosphate:nucleotide phosphotransferase